MLQNIQNSSFLAFREGISIKRRAKSIEFVLKSNDKTDSEQRHSYKKSKGNPIKKQGRIYHESSGIPIKKTGIVIRNRSDSFNFPCLNPNTTEQNLSNLQA